MPEVTEVLGEDTFTLEFSDGSVEVSSRGEIASPMREGSSAWGYSFSATIDGDTYRGEGHGSIADFEEGKPADEGFESMGWTFLAELFSAANDPDEFWGMATGYGEAMPGNRETVQDLLDLLRFTEKHEDVLTSDALAQAIYNRQDTVGDC
jgi:hypothetical protein